MLIWNDRGRLAGAVVAGLMLAIGALVATWAAYLLYEGIDGQGESPRLFLLIGGLSMFPALLLVGTAALILVKISRSARVAHRET